MSCLLFYWKWKGKVYCADDMVAMQEMLVVGSWKSRFFFQDI